MANSFPTLTSGAITQYPAAYGLVQNTAAVRFLDGSDQRFLTQAKQLRRWQIQLQLLNDSEIGQLEAFFDSLQGAYSTFTFTDPATGSEVPNCRIAAQSLTSVYESVQAAGASLWVIETNV